MYQKMRYNSEFGDLSYFSSVTHVTKICHFRGIAE